MSDQKKYSEDQLIGLLKQRDQQAFSYLYDNYAPALYGVITRLVNDLALAEDILQEAFVKIWDNFGAYDSSRGRLFTWMLNITRNLSIDTLRSKTYKNQRKIAADENFVSNLPDSAASSGKLDAIGLGNQLNRLKAEQRTLIELAYFNGYTQDEIARQTGIPLGTVKTRLRAAIIELKRILQSP